MTDTPVLRTADPNADIRRRIEGAKGILDGSNRFVDAGLQCYRDCVRLLSERDQLLKALEDLSFECDGVTRVNAPSRATYNRTFAVLRKIRDGVTIEVPK